MSLHGSPALGTASTAPAPEAFSPRISIALCTYNGARYLGEQLASLAAQSRLPDELVVCDDVSEDDTVSLLERFAQTAPFPVRVLRNPCNLGYSRNFAQALDYCTGDLIALADQDDRWHPDKLQRLEQLFRDNPAAGGVFTDGDLMDEQSAPVAGTLWGSFLFGPGDRQKFRSGRSVDVLLQRNVVTGMAFAFRSAHRAHLRSLPPGWPHDAWLALTIAMESSLIACPERLVTYRVHPQQQIGVPITRVEKKAYLLQHGVAAYLDLSRERNLSEYRQAYAQYRTLPAVLASGSDAQRRWLPQAKAKADHLRAAAERLALPRLRRAPAVLRHWRDYRSYSPTGLSAMLRDLLLGGDGRPPRG